MAQLITPQLLKRMRAERAQAELEVLAYDLAKLVSSVLTYERVLERMLGGAELFDLKFQTTDENLDMAALDAVVRPRLQPHMATLIDAAHYDWVLEREPGGHFRLRVTARPSSWRSRILDCNASELQADAASMLLERMTESGWIGGMDDVAVKMDMGLHISWTGFMCHFSPSGRGAYAYQGDTLLSIRPASGMPRTIANELYALIDAAMRDVQTK